MGRSREAFQKIQTAVELGGEGQAELELAVLCWQGGLSDEAARRFLAALQDPDLPDRSRREAERGLARLRGPGLAVGRKSAIDDYVEGQLGLLTDLPADMLRQAHLATCGITRLYFVMAGTVGSDPVGDELDRLQRIVYDAEGVADLRGLAEFNAEFDRSVQACARAVRALAEEGADRQVDVALAAYSAESSRGASPLEQMARAARAQIKMLHAWLVSHPRSAELTLQADAALRRMKARTAVSPGDMQAVVCADCALVEMLAAVISAGPSGFEYSAAAGAAIERFSAADAASPDSLTQFRASRAAVYKMLWILSRQVRETGMVPIARAVREGGA
jgi:hypothetical protein